MITTSLNNSELFMIDWFVDQKHDGALDLAELSQFVYKVEDLIMKSDNLAPNMLLTYAHANRTLRGVIDPKDPTIKWRYWNGVYDNSNNLISYKTGDGTATVILADYLYGNENGKTTPEELANYRLKTGYTGCESAVGLVLQDNSSEPQIAPISLCDYNELTWSSLFFDSALMAYDIRLYFLIKNMLNFTS